jgi:hypothetical protein
LEASPDLTDQDEVLRESAPSWMPADVWRELLDQLAAGRDGVEVFENRSPSETDIVGVVRDDGLGAYAEMVEDVDRLYGIRGVLPPGRLEALTGQSSEQAAVRWLAQANADYNRFMMREVRAGRTVREARRRYQQHAHTRLVTTILQSVQRGVGPGTAREAEAAVNAFQFIMGLIGSEDD